MIEHVSGDAEQSRRPAVLVVLQSPLHVRNFVTSGFLGKLFQKADPVVVAPQSSHALIRGELGIPHSDRAVLLKLELFERKGLGTWLMGLFRNASIIKRRNLNQTYRNKFNSAWFQLGYPSWKVYLAGSPGRFMFWLLSCLLNLEKIILFIEKRLPVESVVKQMLDDHNPDCVFTSTLIHENKDINILKGAAAKGIRKIAFVVSWDNLSSKGMFLVKPDKLLVWGEEDAKTAQKEHDIPEESIVVTGAPQFDQYFIPDHIIDRNVFLQSRGLDPRKKIILFAGTSFSKYAGEPLAVKKISEALLGEGLDDVVIWYRTHPRALRPESLEVLGKSRNIYIDEDVKKRIDEERFGFSMDRQSLQLFPSLVNACELVATVYSSMTVEFNLFGKPSIQINFGIDKEGNEIFGGNDWIRTNAHHNPLWRSQGNVIANDTETVVEITKKIIAGEFKKYDGELRNIGDKIAFNSDAGAQERILSFILSPV